MGGLHDREQDSGRLVAVVEGEIQEGSWQQLDPALSPLARVNADGPGENAGAPAAGPTHSFGSVVDLRLPKPVPGAAFVCIGRVQGAASTRPYVQGLRSRPVANDNRAGASDKRSVLRDLVFLVILAATVIGAFWSGRMQGYQKVIVVPGPSSFYSQVT